MTKYLTILSALAIIFSSCGKRVTEVTEVTQQITEVRSGALSVTFQAEPADWGTNDNRLYGVQLNVPELVDSIYNYGAVVTYLSFASTDFYEALPETFDGIAYGSAHMPGVVSVDYHALDGTDPGLPDEGIFIKIVLIPAQSVKAHPGVDLRNFKEVQKIFLNKD